MGGMAFTQTDLDNINAAIASGELRASVNGRTVEYRSVAELERARGIIEADLAKASVPAAGRRTSFHFQFATTRERQ